MIDTCNDCEYTILVADLIATLMTKEKNNEFFLLKIWYTAHELPFIFNSNSAFEFLQEGIRIDTLDGIFYLWYDAIECFKVEMK